MSIGETHFAGFSLQKAAEGSLCRETMEMFDKLTQDTGRLFAAMRIAKLEMTNRYRRDIHDQYFQEFDWRNFSDAEIAMCPPVFILTEVGPLMRSELTEFSYLLASARPIKTLAIKPDARIDYRKGKEAKKHQLYFSQELGSLAIAHRHTYVLQSTPVSPAHLFQGLIEGLSRNLPGVFYVLNHPVNKQWSGDAYLWTSAAGGKQGFSHFQL